MLEYNCNTYSKLHYLAHQKVMKNSLYIHVALDHVMGNLVQFWVELTKFGSVSVFVLGVIFCWINLDLIDI